ncbi:MAG: hypothetical protein PF508_08530 [Spirochaeta sp.]|jgi:hypothetical protein|nr:hypothetical protein [Spirochaeta sp.]
MAKSSSKKHTQPGSPENQAKRRDEKARHAARRRHKRIAVIGAVVVLIALGLGATIAAVERSEDRVHDLTAVGQGVPAVVQVHDTTCPVCSELRANIERIEDDFSDDQLVIRVADIHTDAGERFARRYTTQRRVTLLFLDGEGEITDIQTGLQTAAQLKDSFESHAAAPE